MFTYLYFGNQIFFNINFKQVIDCQNVLHLHAFSLNVHVFNKPKQTHAATYPTDDVHVNTTQREKMFMYCICFPLLSVCIRF